VLNLTANVHLHLPPLSLDRSYREDAESFKDTLLLEEECIRLKKSERTLLAQIYAPRRRGRQREKYVSFSRSFYWPSPLRNVRLSCEWLSRTHRIQAIATFI